ncbi:MAG: hypothetical protein II295_04765 [Akkermansia sp.]|jgi:hypothetical protein|nr:hypothetical protein [Akkermansia sp.]
MLFSDSKTPSRYAGRIEWPFIAWMSIFAIIVASCGVFYAIFKNEQVAVKTEINKLQREIAICRMNTNQYRAKTNAQTNRWAMRSRLQQDGSSLREINRTQIEFARTMRDNDRLSARASR